MKNNGGLFDIFIDGLAAIYDGENQIVVALPKLAQAATTPDLKEAFNDHLAETKNQVKRLEKIFSIIKQKAPTHHCKVMESLLNVGDEYVKNISKSLTLDAALISAAQKVEHFEMATYGSLRSFAKTLDLDSDIKSLLQETLDEEGAADKKLTKIADGSIFTSGVNQEAVSRHK
jgi:ferritin-like metal-binding protein YciE